MFGFVLRALHRPNVQLFERTMAFYAVAKGRKVGIYGSWAECQEQVTGFKGAVFKKFNLRREAEEFIGTKASHGSYTPDEFAVPLGKKQPPPVSWAAKEEHKSKSEDYWPEDVQEDDNVTENEMMAAMDEVEGFAAPSSSRKRRTEAVTADRSKIPRHASNVEEGVALKQFGAFQFTIDSEGFVIVYTDGSCLGNGRPDACAGFGVYFGDDHPLNAAKPVLGRVTNNVGEIQAAIYAIKTALDLGIRKLGISTDSQFLINSITMWVPGWKKRGWRLKNNEPVKNVADFKELDELLQSDDIQVKWNYVVAHKGIKGNEMADKLARQGSQLYREMNCRN